MLLDEIDYQILKVLSENSRIQWKELGEKIHMTGQAVGNRIKKLEEQGIIEAYSTIVNEMKLGLSFTAFVTVFMKTTNHHSFIGFINEKKEIREAHRISGEGCYLLKVKVKTQEQLNGFLSEILAFGNYRLNLSIQLIKNKTNLFEQ